MSVPGSLLEQCGARAQQLEEQARKLEEEAASTVEAISAQAGKLRKDIRETCQTLSETVLKQKEVLKQKLVVKELAARKLYMNLPNLTPARQQEEWEKLDMEEVNSSFHFTPAQWGGMGKLCIGAENMETEEIHNTKKEDTEYMEVEVDGKRNDKLEQEVVNLRDANIGTDHETIQLEGEPQNLDGEPEEADKLKKLKKSSNLENWVERQKSYMLENINNHPEEGENVKEVVDAKKDKTTYTDNTTHTQCPMCDKSFSSALRMKEHLSTVHLCKDLANNYIDEAGCCGDCGKKFQNKNILVRHIGATHNKVLEILKQLEIPIPNILVGSNKRKRKMLQQNETGQQLKIIRSQTYVRSLKLMDTSEGSKAFLSSGFNEEMQKKGDCTTEAKEVTENQVSKKRVFPRLEKKQELIHFRDRAARIQVLGGRAAVRKIARRPFIAVENEMEVEDSVQCIKCSYMAVDPRGLKIHISHIHTGRGSLECPICDFRADKEVRLSKHIDKWHKEEGGEQV